MSKNNKGPMITVCGQQMRALPDVVLLSQKDALSEEIMYWRGEVAALNRTVSLKQGELDKAEVTIRNQDVELRRAQRRIAELESGPADEVRTRITTGENRGS